jgi:chromosomal replication initiator protein
MDPLSDAVWGEILAHVRAGHPDIARGWFGQLQPGPLAQGQLMVYVPDDAQLAYLREHCTRPFTEAGQAATGRLISVSFAPAPPTAARSAGRYSRFLVEEGSLALSDGYTFENFVVGPCNRLAHASGVAVSDSPGHVYNPLFIHGSVGLGKTHLLQAICQKILERIPTARLLYLTCETFVNQFIEAVEKGALHEFRYRYRHVDLLVIDDIQFLAGSERTQEEFFHTFNTLYQLHKQIILSADSPPSDIPSLEERLVSRFNWGLVARIDPPGLETRMAIIQKKMRMRGMELPEDVVLFIASRIKSNSRELEGALTAIHGHAAAEGNRPIDLELAQRALGGSVAAERRSVSVQVIMDVVAQRFNVKLGELQGRKRNRTIALARQVCMYLARNLTTLSLAEIGGFFGGRDHTTVLHGYNAIAEKRAQDPAFCARLDEIEEALKRA